MTLTDKEIENRIQAIWNEVKGEKGLRWKRGKAGGTKAQKEYADKVVPFALPVRSLINAIKRGNGSTEEAVASAKKCIGAFGGDSAQFLDAYAGLFEASSRLGNDQVSALKSYFGG